MLKKLPDHKKCKISIIGLGYVGLPLAIEFAKTHKEDKFIKNDIYREVIGYDIEASRINELNNNFDRTNEIDINIFKRLKNLKISHELKEIFNSDVFIITVPTPIDKSKRPDITLLKNAMGTVSNAINSSKKNKAKTQNLFTIIIESTVYPGVCEDICVPIIEKETGYKLNIDFIFGYSPERINPGDKKHKIDNIVKVTSGSNKEGSVWIDNLYKSIIKVGTFMAKDIKTAEAAKVIENIQRDLNISLMNELTMIFNKLNINTLEVLKCSETKWNFLPFRPGLVGGHCIGVDPYYLTHIAEEIGHSPKLITAGRRINDSMAIWFTQEIIKKISNLGLIIKDLEVLIMGFTFKENCPDFRNTKVKDIYKELLCYGAKPIIFDPILDSERIRKELNLNIIEEKNLYQKRYKVIIVTLEHEHFRNMKISDWQELKFKDSLIFDLKGFIDKSLFPITF